MLPINPDFEICCLYVLWHVLRVWWCSNPLSYLFMFLAHTTSITPPRFFLECLCQARKVNDRWYVCCDINFPLFHGILELFWYCVHILFFILFITFQNLDSFISQNKCHEYSGILNLQTYWFHLTPILLLLNCFENNAYFKSLR